MRSIGKANELATMIRTQADFDKLFTGLYHPDRKVVMRTADAMEKITSSNPGLLQKHKPALLKLAPTASAIELKWHLALLLPRLELTKKETANTWDILARWAREKKESRIVRANSIQGLFQLKQQHPGWSADYERVLTAIMKEQVPSLLARIRKLEKS